MQAAEPGMNEFEIEALIERRNAALIDIERSVAVDLQWIDERPGRKLLLKGNHDGWWTSAAKVRRALPPGCELLQNNALEWEGRVIVGATRSEQGIPRGAKESGSGMPDSIVLEKPKKVTTVFGYFLTGVIQMSCFLLKELSIMSQ